MGPMVGAVADQGGRRKTGIAAFSGVCAIATALLWTVRPAPASVWPAMLLVGVGIVTTELAGVLYNAMLPDLAPPDRIGRWSGWGWSAGYAGGLACLVVALFAFIRGRGTWLGLDPSTAEPVRATFVFVALWYVVFALPLFLFVPDAGPRGVSAVDAIRAGAAQLAASLREVRRFGDIVRFLVARMLYIDGLGTVFAFGGVYAAGTFDMDEQQVLLFGIALNRSAGLGAAAFAWVDDRLGAERTIVLSLIGLIVSASAILLGLYALSGKATAFVRPLAVGWVTYATSSQRIGMASVLLFFVAGLLLMLALPGIRGSLYKRGDSGAS